MINKYSDGRTYRPVKIGIAHIPENVKKKNGSKYGNQKTEVNEIVFDSKRESAHYTILTQLLMGGYIKSFERQVKYVLQEKYRNAEDKGIREIRYFADFDVIDNNDILHTIDSKGYETDVFKIKKKLFEYKFKRTLHCINEDSQLHKMFVKE